MVIRRESSGVSSLKNLEAWRWPPRVSVAVPTRVHVDRFSNFSKGVKWGDLGDGRQNPPGEFRGSVGDPGNLLLRSWSKMLRYCTHLF